jgi:UDP-glucose-4-epimerase GalE
MKSRILVTGGAGYIGSHTSKSLAANGFEPICYDNLSTGHREFVKWGPLEVGNLHDTSLLVKIMQKYKPAAVIHFAASAYVGESVADPFKYYQNNVGGTLSLLEAMQKTNIRKIVFSSTCATYGMPNPNHHLIDEDCPQSPINPYGQSKLMIEKILNDLAKQNKISQISLRYFNAAGADKDCEIGEKHDPETHLIPLAIESALKGNLLNIYGTDYPTPDGTAIRDYIHVEDLADAHVKAVEGILLKTKSEFINLGTGKGFSVSEIIRALESLGLQVNFKNIRRREGDPAYLIANPNKAIQLLNWKPKYTQIQDILKTAINWHKNQLQLK